MLPTQCRYRTEGDEEYTINRPGDIGNLTRTRVWCLRDGDGKSREECFNCWSHGYNRKSDDEPKEVEENKVLTNEELEEAAAQEA